MRTFEIPFSFASTKYICEKKNGRRIYKAKKKLKKKILYLSFFSICLSIVRESERKLNR